MKKINTETLFDRLSKVVIISFMIIFLILSAYAPLEPNGESANYIVSTVAFERHPFSQRILPEDIDQVQYDYPEQYEHVKIGRYYETADDILYPYYFPTYSASVIPVKWILKAIGQVPSRAYVFSNTLYYTLALLLVYLCLKASRRIVFLIILQLACSPAIVYYYWVSSEMFICSLMIITMVFWINGNYKLSGLFCSIASTLNITICIVCFTIILDHLLTEYIRPDMSVKVAIKQNWKKTIFLAPYFMPALFMPIFNLYVSGSITLQTSILTSDDMRGQAGRMLAYLFDLNLGFLPYFPILLILFFILGVMSIRKRDIRAGMVFISFLTVIASYSLMPHINSGMATISRYNAWSSPILIIGVTALLPNLLNHVAIKHIFPKMCVASAVVSAIVVAITMKSYWGSSVWFTPVARTILNNIPTLYNPLPSTFMSRTLHIDGGYNYSQEPIVYVDSDNIIKKILVPQGTANMVLEKVYGDAESISDLMEKLEKAKEGNKEYTYINLYSNVKQNLGYDFLFNPLTHDNLDTINKGVYGNEGAFHWVSPDATIYLREGSLPKRGLKVEFGIPKLDNLGKIDSSQSLKTDIYINNELIESIDLVDYSLSELRSVTIDSSDMPESEYGIYEIRLLTNGVYNPFKAGHSGDNRDLALCVSYIGPNE
jgi:hypothetical protein